MNYFLIGMGTVFIIFGIMSKRKQESFVDVMDEENESASPLAQTLDSIHQRLDEIELKVYNKNNDNNSNFEELMKKLNFEDQSVDEISQLTGIKKGEVILLKRILQE